MTNILDLSDEILQNIAYFTNKDAYIPLPVFRPHWANFRLEIHPELQLDFFNFRSTCRRIRSVCRLENLHWRIETTTRIGVWTNYAPDEVIKAVRRLYLMINFRRGEERGQIYSIWAMITTLLNRLSSLEELVLDWVYCCGDLHYDFENHPFPLTLPNYPILNNLKSLSIGTQCYLCRMTLARLLVPACPKIKHLRIQLEPWYDGEEEHCDPGDVLKRLVKEWRKTNNQDIIPIETAYIKVPTCYPDPLPGGGNAAPNAIGITARMAGEVFPHLKKLTLGTYDANDCMDTKVLVLAFQVEKDEDKDRGKAGEWEFELLDAEGQPLNEYLSTLPEFPNLKLIDLSFQISIPEIPSRPPVYPEVDYSFKSYLRKKRLERIRYSDDDPRSFKAQYISALTSAAYTLLHRIPSLEGGIFWQSGTEASSEDWYVWRWYTTTDHQSGKKVVEIDQDPLAVSEDFITCRDGEEAMYRVEVGEGGWPSDFDTELAEWM